MPLANIALLKGKPADYRHAISDAVHRVLVEIVGIPEADRFHLITEIDRDNLIYDPAFLGIARTDDLIVIQILLRTGRSRETRVRLHERIARLLAERPGVRPEDVFIALVENDHADWSPGRGEAPLMALLEAAGA